VNRHATDLLDVSACRRGSDGIARYRLSRLSILIHLLVINKFSSDKCPSPISSYKEPVLRFVIFKKSIISIIIVNLSAPPPVMGGGFKQRRCLFVCLSVAVYATSYLFTVQRVMLEPSNRWRQDLSGLWTVYADPQSVARGRLFVSTHWDDTVSYVINACCTLNKNVLGIPIHVRFIVTLMAV